MLCPSYSYKPPTLADQQDNIYNTDNALIPPLNMSSTEHCNHCNHLYITLCIYLNLI